MAFERRGPQVPPESYYDVTTSAFDLSLLHAYPEVPPPRPASAPVSL